MEAKTNIRQMLAGNKVYVPAYQRAYSWDTETEFGNTLKQVNVFLGDLEDYVQSKSPSPYYFGHFLFEKNDGKKFGIIDGQQRLTTIVILLSAIFSRIVQIRPLSEEERELREDCIQRNSTYRFETVDYDRQLFNDYVIDQNKSDRNQITTVSGSRFITAFDYFRSHFVNKEMIYLKDLLDAVQYASCTTHEVTGEAEAIQMFIFQNNRGKKPSNLEIIKARFMYTVNLFGGEETPGLSEEIKNRFERIYKSISVIEHLIDEDDILLYTLRVYFNSLWENNSTERIDRSLEETDPIEFIRNFSRSLAQSFEHLTQFLGVDEKNSIAIHSLITLGVTADAMPFIIKAYRFGLASKNIDLLCTALESMILRNRLIGTRADIRSRLSEVYEMFSLEKPDIKPILDRIEMLKSTTDWWWAYWNNDELRRSLSGGLSHPVARFVLWKYEHHLERYGMKGYKLTRFDKIQSPELEHIAPQSENPDAGYVPYDQEFKNMYLDCLGNYLLISKSHNCSRGNKPFAEKLASYTSLKQQLEVVHMAGECKLWTKELIRARKEKIVQFVLEMF